MSEHDWRKGKTRKGEGCMRLTDTSDRDNLVRCTNPAIVAYTRRDDWHDGYGVRETRQSWCHEHDPNRTFVNLYLEYRNYGGPEEGGWYYNAGQPIGSIRAESTSDAKEICAALWEAFDTISKRERRSYDEGRYVAMVEDHWPRPYPSKRPHYE